MEEWRGNRFKTEYVPLVRPFSAVPELLHRMRDAGLRIAVASSAKKDEVDKYIDIARITDLVDLKTSSDDVEESKPAPDIFEVVLKNLKIEGADAIAIGDTPYDAEAARKAKIATLCDAACGLIRSGKATRPAGAIEHDHVTSCSPQGVHAPRAFVLIIANGLAVAFGAESRRGGLTLRIACETAVGATLVI
jgi:phosphoglycolate phosphatase-like HAD superfamily hydrolase